MRTRHTRISAGLLLVLISLLTTSLACYSGQVPGLFELTPFYTPTPLNTPEAPRFSELELVLAPQESGRTFFNLTTDPEPLSPNLVNSKSMCQGDAAAQILFAGIDHFDEVYYLVDCSGSVGWVAEDRLAGPLLFAIEELALTIAPQGGVNQSIELLDDALRPLPFNPLQSCKPESVVQVGNILAADPEGDGVKTIFYRIDCPTTGGPLRGWVTDDDLFGPVPLDVDERALAFAAEGDFEMASEPGPVAPDNEVEGECNAGDILVSQEVRLVNGITYYRMACGDMEGWITPDHFVGPLEFDTGVNVVVYVPPIPVFADEIALATEEVGEDVEAFDGDETADVTDLDAAPAGDGAERSQAQGRQVVQITPPLYLTDNPGPPILAGEDANVAGECSTGMVAYLEDYAAVDTIYYQVTCNECVTDEDGELVCEDRMGWADQQYLQGPVDFVVGREVMFRESSSAVEEDESGNVWARIPPNIESAGTIGAFTRFAGRCLQSEGMEITGIVLEKDRTRNQFSFFYTVQCTGQSSTVTEERDGNIVRPKVTYNDDETLVTGYVSGRDLVALDD